ncbi:hypothetical protein [Haladaptatus sp. T7]|uniref:hypothetical protein n=1 Tax=Haladaptatus sp. T7 TaxID=2029368 RepID=UPI0021A2583C|nr:hypothetical protein [Haladaptatus sp. T7]GKZ12304.1 hypothetical protein HAL_01850 [Haladaptatus sp. T7]
MATKQSRKVLFPGSWWVPILSIPISFLLWLSVTFLNTAFAQHVGLQVSGYLSETASVLTVVNYALSLFAPFALYYDRTYVSEKSKWTPTLLYLFIFVPLLNVLIATFYLARRHRFVGTP